MLGSLGMERRAVQATAWGNWGDEYNPTFSGAQVDNHSALQLLTVYGCNRFICDGISTLPVDQLRDRGDGHVDEITKASWLTQPTVDLDWISWATQVLTSLLLAGNAYLWKIMDPGTGRLLELIPLDPDKVAVRRNAGIKTFYVNGAEKPADKILHIPGVMFPGAEVGLSPVEYARQSIGSGISAQEFAGGFFDRSAVLSGVIEVPSAMSPDVMKETARLWGKKHSGKNKTHLPGVLEGGATWKPTQITNEQAQFLQTRGYTAGEIAGQMFLIDPSELGIPVQSGGSLTYANLAQRNERKVQVTFLPWIIRLEHALSSLLARPQYVKLNVDGLLRGDQQARYEGYALALGKGGGAPWMTVNEPRALEDLPPIEGGDVIPSGKTAPSPDGGAVDANVQPVSP